MSFQPVEVVSDPAAQRNFDRVTAVQTATSALFANYRKVFDARGQTAVAQAAGTYVIGPGGFFIANSGAGSALGITWFDPAMFPPFSRANRCAIRLIVTTNATAPAMNFSLNINTITAITGAAGVAPGLTVGGAPTGAGVAVNAPGASATTQAISADFAAPAAARYCMTVVLSAGMAANSIATCVGEWWVRQT